MSQIKKDNPRLPKEVVTYSLLNLDYNAAIELATELVGDEAKFDTTDKPGCIFKARSVIRHAYLTHLSGKTEHVVPPRRMLFMTERFNERAQQDEGKNEAAFLLDEQRKREIAKCVHENTTFDKWYYGDPIKRNLYQMKVPLFNNMTTLETVKDLFNLGGNMYQVNYHEFLADYTNP